MNPVAELIMRGSDKKEHFMLLSVLRCFVLWVGVNAGFLIVNFYGFVS